MDTVIVENSTIDSLTYNHTILNQFPFLRDFYNRKSQFVKRGCSNCSKNVQLDYNPIKLAIISLPEDQLNIIKNALGAKKLRVVYKIGQNRYDTTV